MAKIKIQKIVYGSLSTTIGDGTLAYSPGVSFKAQEVGGLYTDIPPVLSSEYSSLLWRYVAENDRFMLTHVQGRHVSDHAMGRVFSYRAAFEVERTELNRTGFSVADFVQTVPRIKQYPQSETWAEETTLIRHKAVADAHKVGELVKLILGAIAMKRRIYIRITTRDRVLHENGIFNAQELNTLVEAIDSLILPVRRYVSFAFCVDEHYQSHLDDTLITMYVRESQFQVPADGLRIDFEQLGSSNVDVSAQLNAFLPVMQMLPGDKEPMLALGAMLDRVQNDRQSLDSLNRILAGNATTDDKNRWVGNLDTLSVQISHFANVVDRQQLIGVVARLDAKKNKDVVEQALNLPKPRRRDSAVEIINQGIAQLAHAQLADLGSDADRWMKFLAQLKDAAGEPMEKSRIYYLSKVDSMGEQYVGSMRLSMAEYAKAHPRKAKDPLFQQILNILHLQSKKKEKLTTEPKSPSNSQMQEEKGRATNVVAEDTQRSLDEFDELYNSIQAQKARNTKKGKIIWAVLGFIIGVLLASGVFYLGYQSPSEPSVIVDPIPSEVLDSLNKDSLTSDSLKPDSVKLDSPKVASDNHHLKEDSLQVNE